MVRIPSEYQEVEYLESTGRQYIDLDFGFDPTDEVELRGAMTNVFQDKWLIAPKHWNTDNNRFSMLGGMSSFMFTFGQQGTPNNILSPAMEGDHNFHTVTYANKIYTVVDTGSIADMTTKSFGSTTANIRLFYGYANNTQGKIAYYHHKKQDGTEINLIPCYHKSDNEIGMYDTVSKQFYTNSGTGTFLKGNDVTYDNINLLESRRRILLNTPHIETVSDTIASFETDVATKIKGCKVYFTPIQEGTGGPSPDNVRPITGWDGITLYLSGSDTSNPTTLTIPFNRTIYGGYVDLVKGEVVEEYNSFILDGENYKFTGASSDGVNTHDMAMTYNYIGYSGLSNLPKGIATANTIYSSSLPINVTANIQGVDYNCIQTYSGTGNRYLRAIISKNELSDVSTGSAITSSINEWFSNNPTQIVYKLATPNTYTLTPETIKALKGVNNIWSNANGNIEVSFYTH